MTFYEDGGSSGGGNIAINGLVRAFHTHGAIPTINVVAFDGAVTNNGTADAFDAGVSGICTPVAPDPLFTDCGEACGVTFQ